MRRTWRIARHERESGLDPHPALLAAPFFLLFAVLVVVKSADSSASFRIDQSLVLENLKQRIAEATQARDPAKPEAAVAAAPVPELREVREVVRKGDTFGAILRRVGVSSAEVTRWSETSHEHDSLARLKPGHSFTFVMPSGTDALAGLQYELSAESMLVMREADDQITAQVERLPRMVETRIATGVIENSLYASATRQGVPESVISSLVDIFGWEVDFSSDLKAGDTFRVAYEESSDTEGGRVKGGRVIAAELVVDGKHWDAVFFEAEDEGGNYYTPEGKSFSRSFLRYPVEFTRISSTFTSSRFHPVLGVSRPHMGVDFAAPRGTPVRAIAAGRVEYAGWHGGSGRYIRIDHGSGVESSYSHLQSISREVRAGSRVQVGQVIGAVGASGLATGPHLHFALFRDGVYVNPLTVRLAAAPPLSPQYMREFGRVRDAVLHQLAGVKIDGSPALRIAASAASSRAN